MDVNDIPTPASELQTSTESDFIHEYVTTMNPLVILTVDQVPEFDIDGLDRMFLFYGLGGILIFFVIYMCCSYFINCKDASQRQEMELCQLNERVSQTSYRLRMNEGRIFVDDFNQPGSTSLTMPSLAEGSCTETSPKYLNVETGTKQSGTPIIDMPQIHYRNPSEIPQRKCLPDDNQCPNTSVKEVAETSSVQMQKDESSNECKSDADIATPTKGDEKQSSPTPEGKSHSSPTSPEIVRRRLTKLEDTPKRPSSWQ